MASSDEDMDGNRTLPGQVKSQSNRYLKIYLQCLYRFFFFFRIFNFVCLYIIFMFDNSNQKSIHFCKNKRDII